MPASAQYLCEHCDRVTSVDDSAAAPKYGECPECGMGLIMIHRPSYIQCPKCLAPIDDTMLDRPEPAPCPACLAKLWIVSFPALTRKAPEKFAVERADEGEASCFFHPAKRAAAACDACGRFVCGLCDGELGNRHLCPECLTRGAETGDDPHLVRQRDLGDIQVLQMSILSTVLPPLWFVWWFSGPLIIVIAMRYWKRPSTILGGSPRVRLSIALILGIIQSLTALGIIVTVFASGGARR